MPMPTGKKRTSLHARAASISRPHQPSIPSSSAANTSTTSITANTKKAKRTPKNNRLLTRVRDSGIRKDGSGTLKQRRRTRRPGNKLKAAQDVSALRDALPAVPPLPRTAEDGDDFEEGEAGEWEGFLTKEEEVASVRRRRKRKVEANARKMVMNSLPHRPGAMKRRRRLERGEMERFGRNLAGLVPRRAAGETSAVPLAAGAAGEGSGVRGADNLAGGRSEEGRSVGVQEKWAALRNFIGATMVRDGAFAGSERVVGVV